MDAALISIAQMCLDGAQDGSLNFPAIVGKLQAAGFDGYAVDYRTGTNSFYLADGSSVVLPASNAVSYTHLDVYKRQLSA